ncbi:MAG: hypothetical protein GY827_05960 [Cytophagales bacterium]|nr:hypothetical protein [Cytophagales bacterium]
MIKKIISVLFIFITIVGFSQSKKEIEQSILNVITNQNYTIPSTSEYRKSIPNNIIPDEKLTENINSIQKEVNEEKNKVQKLDITSLNVIFEDIHSLYFGTQYLFLIKTNSKSFVGNISYINDYKSSLVGQLTIIEGTENDLFNIASTTNKGISDGILYYLTLNSKSETENRIKALNLFLDKHSTFYDFKACFTIINKVSLTFEELPYSDVKKWINTINSLDKHNLNKQQKEEFKKIQLNIYQHFNKKDPNNGYYKALYIQELIEQKKHEKLQHELTKINCNTLQEIKYLEQVLPYINTEEVNLPKLPCINLTPKTEDDINIKLNKTTFSRGEVLEVTFEISTDVDLEENIQIFFLENGRKLPVRDLKLKKRISSSTTPIQQTISFEIIISQKKYIKSVTYLVEK